MDGERLAYSTLLKKIDKSSKINWIVKLKSRTESIVLLKHSFPIGVGYCFFFIFKFNTYKFEWCILCNILYLYLDRLRMSCILNWNNQKASMLSPFLSKNHGNYFLAFLYNSFVGYLQWPYYMTAKSRIMLTNCNFSSCIFCHSF